MRPSNEAAIWDNRQCRSDQRTGSTTDTDQADWLCGYLNRPLLSGISAACTSQSIVRRLSP
jgi:hypothetical protein